MKATSAARMAFFASPGSSGPMTRTVTDGAKVLDVIAGHDPADDYTDLGRDRRESDYTRFAQVYQGVDAGQMASWRLALLEAYVQGQSLQPDEAAAALERARELGAP